MTLPALIGLDDAAALWVRAIRVAEFGRVITLDLRSEVGEHRLILRDCREHRWRAYGHEAEADESRVVSFAPGRDAHRSPLQLLTEHTALWVIYGTLAID